MLCYKGQLDKIELLRKGLQPDRQFELSNLPGNAVTKRCEDAGHPGWHGILIYTDDQGQWLIKFSTTDRLLVYLIGLNLFIPSYSFVISGTDSKSRTEMLVYKLASAKNGGESFLSKIFG